jgi:hypothetical protein
MVGDDSPFALPVDEYVRRLREYIVNSVGVSAGHLFGAGHPAGVAFDVNHHCAERDFRATRVGENSYPAFANLGPSEKQIPSGMDALHPIIVSPDFVHLSDIERFESRVVAAIRVAQRHIGRLNSKNGFGHLVYRGLYTKSLVKASGVSTGKCAML